MTDDPGQQLHPCYGCETPTPANELIHSDQFDEFYCPDCINRGVDAQDKAFDEDEERDEHGEEWKHG